MRYMRIPLDEEVPWYDFRISLSDVRYIIEVRYNTRMDRWVLSISDAAQNPLLHGIVLLTQRDLIGQYTTLPLPPGPLFVVDNGGTGQPTLASFLTDHMFIYGDPTT